LRSRASIPHHRSFKTAGVYPCHNIDTLRKVDSKRLDIRVIEQQGDNNGTIRGQVEKCASRHTGADLALHANHFLEFATIYSDSLHGLVRGKEILKIEISSVRRPAKSACNGNVPMQFFPSLRTHIEEHQLFVFLRDCGDVPAIG